MHVKRLAPLKRPPTFRLFSYFQSNSAMPREHIILECTEARAEGKPVSRYMSTRDKKKQPERVEKKKYNKFLRRHTVHREIKG
jgi:large subunit ribosomal protein L33